MIEIYLQNCNQKCVLNFLLITQMPKANTVLSDPGLGMWGDGKEVRVKIDNNLVHLLLKIILILFILSQKQPQKLIESKEHPIILFTNYKVIQCVTIGQNILKKNCKKKIVTFCVIKYIIATENNHPGKYRTNLIDKYSLSIYPCILPYLLQPSNFGFKIFGT